MEKAVETSQPLVKESSFTRVITQISRVMAAIGAIMFGAMMMITVIDVSGRKLFLHPLNGAVELVGLMLVIGASWGMGYCELLGMNIRISILSDKLSKRFQNILGIITYLVSLATVGLISWQAYSKVHSYLENVLGSTTDILAMPFWPFVMMMGLGFTWAGFIFIVNLSKSISEVFKK